MDLISVFVSSVSDRTQLDGHQKQETKSLASAGRGSGVCHKRDFCGGYSRGPPDRRRGSGDSVFDYQQIHGRSVRIRRQHPDHGHGKLSRILEYPISADRCFSSGSSFFISNDGSERIYEKISIPFCAVSDSGVSGRNPDGRILNMEERKNVNGSTVVEMAYIIPLFLFFFVILIHTVFYYHDKVILSGAACETAAVSAQEKRRYGTREFDPEAFFTERIRGKLILLTVGEISITENDNETAVEVSAGRSFMKLNICQKAVAAEPEEVIRWVK